MIAKRKKEGVALSWYEQTPRHLIDVPAPTYLDLESFEVAQLIGHMQRAGDDSVTAVPTVEPSKAWWRFGNGKTAE